MACRDILISAAGAQWQTTYSTTYLTGDTVSWSTTTSYYTNGAPYLTGWMTDSAHWGSYWWTDGAAYGTYYDTTWSGGTSQTGHATWDSWQTGVETWTTYLTGVNTWTTFLTSHSTLTSGYDEWWTSHNTTRFTGY
jgi:hypothetical protein